MKEINLHKFSKTLYPAPPPTTFFLLTYNTRISPINLEYFCYVAYRYGEVSG
jgi:hypothetical protein